MKAATLKLLLAVSMSVLLSACSQQLSFLDPGFDSFLAEGDKQNLEPDNSALNIDEDFDASSPSASTVTLPIEVLGAPGTTRSIKLTLPAASPTPKGLSLKIHGLIAENMASVKVNDSAWLSLNDTSVVYPRKEKAFFGMGGILSTLRMVLVLPAGTVREGENIISFRYEADADTKGIGFRVLGVNFIDESDREIKAEEKIVQDDPRTWTPPILTAQAINEGKILWYSAPIKLGTQNLRVSCSDCHAHDGRDLKYFNYSNRSIIERSVFHKLSRTDGEKIASYIRSLSVPYEENGRPWNPPYQPGPGLDSKPVRSWAAGAGLNAVLEDDLDTLKYIFPNGITQGSIDLTKTMSAREIPLVIQFPDWNHWLPQIHPNDAFPDAFPDGPFVENYTKLRNSLKGKTPLEAAKLIDRSGSVWDNTLQYLNNPKPKTEREDPAYLEWHHKRKGLSHWRVVKIWEMMTEFNAEDQGQEIDGSGVNDRRWYHGEVFRLAPHLLGGPHIETFAQESMQWYQLQLALNDGNRKNPSIVPIDWGYLHALNLSSWNNPISMPTYGIAILNMIKGGEVTETGEVLGSKNGWDPNYQNTAWLAPGSHLSKQYRSIDINIRRKVAEAVIESWIKKAESYTPSEYYAANKATEGLRNKIIYSYKNLSELGCDPKLMARLQKLKESLWPGLPDGDPVDPVDENVEEPVDP